MVYAVYCVLMNGDIGLVEILKNKREARKFIPTAGYFLTAWKHLGKYQVENLYYAQAREVELVIEENIRLFEEHNA